MNDALVAVGLGAATGILAILSRRLPLLGWFAFSPLAAAVFWLSPVLAGLSASVAGLLAVVPSTWGRLPTRSMELTMTMISIVVWGAIFALAAWVWPHDTPAWGALVIPISAVALSAGARFGAPPKHGGSPRFYDFTLTSQQRWLPVVHIARLGSDLVIPALLALAATVPIMLVVQLPPNTMTVLVAAAGLLVIGGSLSFGWISLRRAVQRVGRMRSLRVAAVAVDDPFSGYAKSPAYQDVDGRIAKYEPRIAQALAGGARLVVLPEHAVIVTSENREKWLRAVSRWAREGRSVIVAGLFDTDLNKNQIVIMDQAGAVAATYEKQRPSTMEPARQLRMPPALFEGENFSVSAVICFDFNFNFFIRLVAKAGGVLAIPSNDWQGIVGLHTPSVVWPAVMAGVPVIRSTSHGVSAVFDAAGRLLAKGNSFDGPVVLVTDMPIAMRSGPRKLEPLQASVPT